MRPRAESSTARKTTRKGYRPEEVRWEREEEEEDEEQEEEDEQTGGVEGKKMVVDGAFFPERPRVDSEQSREEEDPVRDEME